MCIIGMEGWGDWKERGIKGGKEAKERSGWREEGVVIGSCLFITSFFFFNHSTVCSIKVKPIER